MVMIVVATRSRSDTFHINLVCLHYRHEHKYTCMYVYDILRDIMFED